MPNAEDEKLVIEAEEIFDAMGIKLRAGQCRSCGGCGWFVVMGGPRRPCGNCNPDAASSATCERRQAERIAYAEAAERRALL